MALRWVRARASAQAGLFGWSISIICGKCSAPSTSKLRHCVRAEDMGERLTVFCPHCKVWNLTELVLA